MWAVHTSLVSEPFGGCGGGHWFSMHCWDYIQYVFSVFGIISNGVNINYSSLVNKQQMGSLITALAFLPSL